MQPPDWVISDTHLSHANILTLCPWRATWAQTIDDHDRQLIAAWRAVVQPDDVVLHLGDVSFGNRQHLAEIRRQLTGNIVLCLGNHDRSAKSMFECGFETVVKVDQFEVPGHGLVIARHDPKLFTAADSQAQTLLHGHWHGGTHRDDGSLMLTIRAKLVDCGVDATRSLAPVRLADILAP